MDQTTVNRIAPILSRLPLFAAIDPAYYSGVLARLNARARAWRTGAFLLMEGDGVRDIHLLLSGGAQVLREDYLGRRSIIAALAPGDLFAETFALAGVPAAVGVQATEDCEALLLDYGQVLRGGGDFDAQLAANLLAMTAGKNLHLNERLSFLEKRTIRERLLAYLSAQARRAGSRSFTIPFDRQQLADYLSVDRSALSAELSRMGREGLLVAKKSAFTLPESAEEMQA